MAEIFVLFFLLGFVAFVANWAERERIHERDTTLPVLLSYGMTALLHSALFFAGIGIQAVGRALGQQDSAEINDLAAQFALDPDFLLNIINSNTTLMGVGLWMPALVGLLLLVPPIRRVLVRPLSRLDPANHVHAVASSLTALVFANLLFTLGLGLETLSASLENLGDATDLILTTWLQNLLTVGLAFVGVGFVLRRKPQAVLERLKLQRLTQRQLLIGLGLGVGMVPLLGGLVALGDLFGLGNTAVDDLSEVLYGPFFASIWGILTVGFAAAIGEETLFRGAIQPVFGRITTAFLFAIVHANYSLSLVTIGIFLVGYVLGWARDRYNTTTSMVIHATFNMIQAIAAYLVTQFPELFEQLESAALWMV